MDENIQIIFLVGANIFIIACLFYLFKKYKYQKSLNMLERHQPTVVFWKLEINFKDRNPLIIPIIPMASTLELVNYLQEQNLSLFNKHYKIINLNFDSFIEHKIIHGEAIEYKEAENK
jgi:hypothetical protein